MNHESILYILINQELLQLNKDRPLQQEDTGDALAVFVHLVLLWIKRKSGCLNRSHLILVKTILFSTYYSMKTRKSRKSKKSRKGGILGVRALKTESENRANCHRLAENYKKRGVFLYRKYKCERHSATCDVIEKNQGIHKQCSDTNINDYDFSGDGKHVKQRLQPFFGSDTVPIVVNKDPWSEMPYHFKKRPNALKEYDLKTEDEITQKYNEKN